MKIPVLLKKRPTAAVLTLIGFIGLAALLVFRGQLSLRGATILLAPALALLIFFGRNCGFKAVRTRLKVDGEDWEIIDYFPLQFWRLSRRRMLFCPKRQIIYSAIALKPGSPMCIMRFFQTFTERYRPERLSRALVLGVAGGALPRYLLEKYPECRVTGVELSPELIALAKRWFLAELPMDRFELLQGDAAEFVRRNHGKEKYEAVYCDLFSGNRPAAEIYNEAFFRKIEEFLAPEGFVMINLFGVKPAELNAIIDAMAKGLGYAALLIHNGGRVAMLGGRPELQPAARRLFAGPLPDKLTLLTDFSAG